MVIEINGSHKQPTYLPWQLYYSLKMSSSHCTPN